MQSVARFLRTPRPETLDAHIARLTETQGMEAPFNPDPRWQAAAWLVVIAAAGFAWFIIWSVPALARALAGAF